MAASTLSLNRIAVEARSELIEARNNLLALAQSLVDTLLVDLKIIIFTMAVLRAIYQLNIAEAVPLNGSISITDLAAQMEVHLDGLRPILRFAFTQGIFSEATAHADHMEHNAISAAIPSIKPILWTCLIKTMRITPSSLHFADSTSLKNWPRPPVTLADPSNGNPGTFLAMAFDLARLGDEAVVVEVGGVNGHNSVSLAKVFPSLKFVVQDTRRTSSLLWTWS
ncbi:hypothetical protein V8F20_011037 [Naviculisporaceae sp. PSN 640]